MLYLAIYIAFCIVGGFYGRYLKNRGKSIRFSSHVQVGVLVLLLFVMGAKLGANEEVIEKLGSLGVTSLILTVFILIGSVSFVFIARKFLKISKEGDSND